MTWRVVNRRLSGLASSYSPYWKLVSSLVAEVVGTETHQIQRTLPFFVSFLLFGEGEDGR